jgi:hypothetical protein
MKGYKLNLVILGAWLALAAVAGVTDNMFQAWSVPSTLFVVKQTHLYPGYLRGAGPFTDPAKCQKAAKTTGPEAFCMRLTLLEAKYMLSSASRHDALERK